MHEVLFDVRASYKIGIGHLIRCLSIAEHLIGKARIFFNIGSQRFASSKTGIEIVNTKQIQRLLPKVVVFDRIKLRPSSILPFKEKGARVILLDSDSCWQMADVIINALPRLSRMDPPEGVKVFDGPSYIALSRIYSSHQRDSRFIKEYASNILVSAGGSDPYGLTLKIAKALVDLDDLVVTFIIGRLFRKRAELEEIIDKKGWIIHQDVNLLPYIIWADIGLSSFGLTVYEASYLGLPTIIIPPTKEHNLRAEIFSRFGSAINLGLNKDLSLRGIREALEDLRSDLGLRRRMANAGMRLVDGEGARRVAKIIMDLINE